MSPDKPVVPTANFELADEIYEAYANNVYYEASSWDLKLFFGQLDQRNGLKVVQHSAITIPWPLAKLMVFWLRGQIEAHELANGKIRVPPPIVPPILAPPTEEVRKADPNADAVYAIFNRLRDEFAASLKE